MALNLQSYINSALATAANSKFQRNLLGALNTQGKYWGAQQAVTAQEAKDAAAQQGEPNVPFDAKIAHDERLEEAKIAEDEARDRGEWVSGAANTLFKLNQKKTWWEAMTSSFEKNSFRAFQNQNTKNVQNNINGGNA